MQMPCLLETEYYPYLGKAIPTFSTSSQFNRTNKTHPRYPSNTARNSPYFNLPSLSRSFSLTVFCAINSICISFISEDRMARKRRAKSLWSRNPSLF
mmetsp:Transcript_8909/g.32877  ORF Transcript_8909/g.32877 Transcript_8909/m.32877 type:complete len:97 (-) Transcript_8909:2502-2792(-)